MKKVLILFLISFILFPYALSSNFNIGVNSPKITTTYEDYDIKNLKIQSGDNVSVSIEVWGNVNVHPAKGYLKEYDVNITDVYGDYVHLFLLSDNGSDPVAFVSISGKIHLMNYSVNKTTLTWILPLSALANISGSPKIIAYAGIIDLSKGEYLFLDKVSYPVSHRDEGTILSTYYILIISVLGGIGIILFYGFRKMKK